MLRKQGINAAAHLAMVMFSLARELKLAQDQVLLVHRLGEVGQDGGYPHIARLLKNVLPQVILV